MFKKIFTLILCIASFWSIGQAQDVLLFAPDTCANAHQPITIAVSANGLENTASVEFDLEFDATILKVLSVQTNPALMGLVNTSIDSTGNIGFSWVAPVSGQTLADSSELLIVNFRVLSSVFDGDVSPLNIVDEEVSLYQGGSPLPTLVTPLIDNGSVTVNCSNFVVPEGKVTVTVDQGDANCDDDQLVIDIVVDSFVNMNGLQFTLAYDNSALALDSTGNFANVPALGQGNFGDLGAQGLLTFSWAQFDSGVTLPNGSVFYSVYFDLVGGAGDDISVSIVDAPTKIEGTVGLLEIPVMIMNGMGSIIDTVPPSITCPADVRVANPMLLPSIVVNDIAPVAASDNCEPADVTYELTGATTGTGSDDASGLSFNKGTTTVTYTVTDGADNTAECSFEVTVADTFKLIALTAEAQCGGEFFAGVAVRNFDELRSLQFSLTWDDTVLEYDSAFSTTLPPTVGIGEVAPDTLTFSWFDMDDMGRTLGDSAIVLTIKFNVIGDVDSSSALCIIDHPTIIEATYDAGTLPIIIPVLTCKGEITVIDTLPPVPPMVPADTTVQCATDVPAADSLTAVFLCAGGEQTVFPVDVITTGSCANNYSIVRTWTFIGTGGAEVSFSQTINVNDNTAPVVPSAPADVNVQCATDVPTPVDLTAVDNCDGDITVSPTSVMTPGSCVNQFTMVRTWTFVDVCGNTSSVSQTINVNDNTPPVAPSAPADVNVQCASDVPAPVDLTAVDNCDGDITVSPSAVITPGSCENQFTQVRTWTFVDVCGNLSSVSQTINVNDNTPPVAPSAPADVNVQCASDVPAPVDLTAVDNCDGDITVSPSAVITPGSCENQFTQVRTWTFVDVCGNLSSVSQTINVNDNTPPVAPSAPADVNVQCASDVPAPVDLTAVDNCDGDITVSPSAVITPGSCENQFTQVRTWTFVDVCGNLSSVSQTINVNDNTPPVAPSAPADVNVQCASDVPAPVDLTAVDNCDGDITVSPSAVITPGSCENQFTQVRTWTFVDVCGNTSSVSQTINVNDNTPPVVPSAPADVNVQCASDVPAPVDLTAVDNCDGDITVSPSAVITPGSCENQFTQVRTWTFVDVCGNLSSVSQTINVNDNTPPVAPSAPADVNVQCASDVPAPVDLTAVDNCDGDITVSPSAVMTPGNCVNQFTMVRTWTFVDICGNSSSVSQTITVNDTIAPTPLFALPQDTTVDCDAIPAQFIPTAADVSDNCSPADSIQITVASSIVPDPNCPNASVITRSWTLTDECGNATTFSQVVTVQDTTSPVITTPANVTVECMESGGGSVTPITQILGSIDPNDPTFNRPNSSPNNSPIPANCSVSSNNVHYEFFEFSIDQADTYTFEMENKIGPDMFAALYQTSFDPANPCMNFLFADDDDGPGTEPLIMIDLNLVPGAYILVTTTFSNNGTNNNAGAYIWNITSQNGGQVYPGFNGPGNTAGGTDTDPSTTGQATATDNCSASDDIEITFSDVFTPACGNTGAIERTFVATDECGNSSTGTQTITIIDETDPVIATPVDVTVECGTSTTTTQNLLVNSDFEQGNTGFTTDYVPGSGGPFGLLSDAGTYAISTSPALVHNNFADCDDHTTGTGNMMVINGSDVANTKVWCQTTTVLPNSPHLLTAWATSAVSGSPAMLQFSVNGGMVGNVFNLNSTTCQWQQFSAVWNSGAVTTAEICIVNQQTNAGGNDFALDDIVFTATSTSMTGMTGTSPDVTGFATATDNCSDSADITITFTDAFVPACGNTGEITRTWVAEDECGNISMSDQIITIEDNTAPLAICQDITVEIGEDGTGTASPEDVDDGSSDICSDNVSLALDPFEFGCIDVGVDQDLVLTVTDECGNTATCEATATIIEIIPPTFTECPSDRTFNLDPGLCEIQFEYDVEATDNCEDVMTTTFLGTLFNGPNNFNGNMFDLENVSGAATTITSFDLNLAPGTHTIEVYVRDGSYLGFQTTNVGWTLVGTQTGVVSNGNNIPTPVDVGDFVLNPGELKGVYVTTTGTTMNYSCFGGNCGAVATTYNDGNLELNAGHGGGYPFNLTFTPRVWNGNIFYTVGACGDVQIDQTDDSGLTSGDFFPRGTTTQTYVATDCNGNTSICEFDLTVKEFPNPKQNLVCNDFINVSLSADDCTSRIGADDLLEGGPYGCYDDYLVEVAFDSNFTQILPGSPEVDGSHIGQTLYVRITDPDNGTICWGKILVEDKNIPSLACSSYTVTCDTDIDPILNGSTNVTRSRTIEPNFIISTVAPSVVEIPFITFPGITSGVTDVNLSIELSHSLIGQVSATLTSPDGTEVDVFLNAGGAGCNSPFMIATFDDQAAPGALPCNAPPAGITGDFQPAQLFSAFNGESANGNWVLTITDGTVSNDGMLTSVTLEVSASLQTGIPLPIPGGGANSTVRIGTDIFGNPIYRLTNFDPCGDATISFMDQVENFDECEDIIQTVTRMYTVIDESGNTATCQDTISRLAGTGSAIAFPADVTVACTSGNTNPSNTGRPNVSGGICSEGFTVFDPVDDMTNDGCGTKILREWTVKINCTGELVTDFQWIAVRDVTAPIIPTCPDTLLALPGTDINCSANIRVYDLLDLIENTLGAFDSCDPDLDYSFLFDGKIYSRSTVNSLARIFLEPGLSQITIFVTNDCGLISECETQIFVEDVPPVANCDQETTVGLGNAIDYDWDNNVATANIANGRVCADRIDDGSYDNCGSIVNYEVRRVDGRLGSQFGTYRDCVYFDCEDLGQEIMVELRVTDEDGDQNTCMASVEVFDKLGPQFFPCPANAVVDCDLFDEEDYTFLDFIDTDDNNGAFPPVFLIITTDNNFRDTVESGFYNGAFLENCGVDAVFINTFGQLDECAAGTLQLEIVAVDGSGNTGSCFIQLKVNETEFEICDTECRTAPVSPSCASNFSGHTLADNVEWPCDIQIGSCGMGLTPNELEEFAGDIGINALDARPQITGEACSQVAVGYQDFNLDVIDTTECIVRKIQRLWKITDWCQPDPTTASGAREWTYTQIIKVAKTSEPSFDACDNITVAAAGNDCSVEGVIEVNASDDCVPSSELEYSYQFDVNNDGTIDFNTELGDFFPGDDPSTPNMIEGTFPVAVHRITFRVTDVCGNQDVCTFLVTVEDTKQPTPVCVPLFTTVMPSTGAITLPASIFDNGSFDNCTDNGDLVFFFDGDPNETDRTWTCDDIVPGFPITVDICVMDEAGNMDCCETTITITDPENVCDILVPTATVSGLMVTEDAIPVGKVDVTASSANGGTPKVMTTGTDGTYAFNLATGYNYEVEPIKDINYKNGVNTFDLVLIAQHILNTNKLDSPYKIIAADANNDKKISTFDILELRKIILNLTDDLPNNTSWRFVDAAYVFPTPTNPFAPAFPEAIDINNLSSDELNNDFIGVKIGDVSGDVIAKYAANDLVLNVQDVALKAGESHTIDFTAQDFEGVFGYQFTLDFDPALLSFTDVQSADLTQLDESNFGLTQANDGRILTSWNANAANLADGATVFSLTFTAKQDVRLSSAINLTSSTLRSEAYTTGGLRNVTLNYNGDNAVNNAFALYQNQPNPFKSRTMIGFNLPQASDATLTIYDVAGKVIFSTEGNFAQGYNTVTVERSEIEAASGVLYYKLESADHTATKKMILMD